MATPADASAPAPAGTRYESAEAFFAADERRRRSPELDFGVLWMQGGSSRVTYRVSYVDATGELYCVSFGEPRRGEVELLGRFRLERCPACQGKGWLHRESGGTATTCKQCAGTGNSRFPVEFALRDWEKVCGSPGSLDWVRERLQHAYALLRNPQVAEIGAST